MLKISKELLEELYVKQGLTQCEVAEKTGLSQAGVSNLIKKYELKKAKKINKLYPNNNKHWTDNDIELLTQLYGTCSYQAMANKLKRSPKSIECKKNDLKLGKAIEYTENINSNELARALGRSPNSTRKWIKTKGLPATKKVIKNERKYYRIDVKEFWKWAKENNNLMVWDKYEIGNLPNEPKWVLEEKKKSFNNPKDVLRRWTDTEEALLIFYYNQGLQLKEIGLKLNRTDKSIDMRLNKLKVPRKQIQIEWKPIEVEILLGMKSEGKTFNQIADELGRSAESVSKKYDYIRCKQKTFNMPYSSTRNECKI